MMSGCHQASLAENVSRSSVTEARSSLQSQRPLRLNDQFPLLRIVEPGDEEANEQQRGSTVTDQESSTKILWKMNRAISEEAERGRSGVAEEVSSRRVLSNVLETDEEESKQLHRTAVEEESQTRSVWKVNEVDSGDSGIGSQSDMSFTDRVVMEIVESETVYVADLQQVVQGYIHYWKEMENNCPLSCHERSALFGNLESIYRFHCSFLEQLRSCGMDPVAVARCFVRNNGGFTIYSEYCTNYPKSVSVLTELLRSPLWSRSLRNRQTELQHRLPLGSYLLKPVQRILKYHLLLGNLSKYYDGPAAGYSDVTVALSAMTGIAHHINDMKRKHEHAVRVQEIQSLLEGWQGADLATFGELVAEGSFRMCGAKYRRHVFLFDSMLLICKRRDGGGGSLHYKTHIDCSNLMLIESVPGNPLSFHVLPFDNPRLQYTLEARNLEQKKEWTFQLKRVILEHYGAEIPAHARQLVLQLGQDSWQKNSSPLAEHPCSRKQYSAPEYLERRRNSAADSRHAHKKFNNKEKKSGKSVSRSSSCPTRKLPSDWSKYSGPSPCSPPTWLQLQSDHMVSAPAKKSGSLPRTFQLPEKEKLPDRPFTIASENLSIDIRRRNIDYNDSEIDHSSNDGSLTSRISQDSIFLHPEHRIYRRAASKSSLKSVLNTVSMKLSGLKSITGKESISIDHWRQKLKSRVRKWSTGSRRHDDDESLPSTDATVQSIDAGCASESESEDVLEDDFYEKSFEVVENFNGPDVTYRDSVLVDDDVTDAEESVYL